MNKIRESNYDLLRIVSSAAVIVLHISGGFLRYNEFKTPENCHFTVMLLNHLVRFAVPCFFMLSGAFLLSDDRNSDYKYFYKKSIKNIGITSIIFCLLYFIYSIIRLMASVFIFKKHTTDHILPTVFDIIKNFVKGEPFYHLWYLFTLIGLYLAVPFLINFANNLQSGGVNIYGKFTSVLIILSSVSYITSDHVLKWDIGFQFCFISYFLMGYKLRQWGKTQKNNRKATLLILSGFVINTILAYINYLRGLKGLPVDAIQYCENPFSYAPLAPIEVLASSLIFAGFSVLDIKINFSKLAENTFLIYLFHAGVWDIISTVLGESLIGNQLMETLLIFIISTLVFFISLLGAYIYKRIFQSGKIFY